MSDGLVRYSVGIEDVEDLIADLRQALDGVPTASRDATLHGRGGANGRGLLAEKLT